MTYSCIKLLSQLRNAIFI